LARRLDDFAGSISVDECEVAEAKWVSLPELRLHAERHPDEYTPWFLEEVRSLGWFGTSSTLEQQAGRQQQGG
jgi:isopentenyldiphosphate isomerase